MRASGGDAVEDGGGDEVAARQVGGAGAAEDVQQKDLGWLCDRGSSRWSCRPGGGAWRRWRSAGGVRCSAWATRRSRLRLSRTIRISISQSWSMVLMKRSAFIGLRRLGRVEQVARAARWRTGRSIAVTTACVWRTLLQRIDSYCCRLWVMTERTVTPCWRTRARPRPGSGAAAQASSSWLRTSTSAALEWSLMQAWTILEADLAAGYDRCRWHGARLVKAGRTLDRDRPGHPTLLVTPISGFSSSAAGSAKAEQASELHQRRRRAEREAILAAVEPAVPKPQYHRRRPARMPPGTAQRPARAINRWRTFGTLTSAPLAQPCGH